MSHPNKTILSAINYFNNELCYLYGKSELEQQLQISFLHCFNLTRIDLVLKRDEIFSTVNFDKVKYVVAELKKHKPLAQILGVWEFYELQLNINKHVLIPRPETEELVQLIVEENKLDGLNVLDIGTGTGCIALSLKKEMLKANVRAFDVSEEALKIATVNAKVNKLEVAFQKVNILDWENSNVKNKFDIIVSNPPYITQKEKELMHKNVLDFEPQLALFVENDSPLLFYNAIANFSLKHLNEKGRLYFEINEYYGIETQQLLINKGFKSVSLIKDMNEKDRIISCYLN